MAYDPNGIHWSGANSTPTTPLSQEVGGFYGGLALGVAAGLGLQSLSVGKRGMSAYDVLQSSIRNVAQVTPFGLGNTFRFAEFMSPGLSAAAQNLSLELSVTGSKKTVGVFELSSDFTQTRQTKEALKSVVGEKAFVDSGLGLVEDGKYELRFERGTSSRGRGSLFFRETGVEPETGKVAPKSKWKQLSNSVSLMDMRGPGDILDIASNVTTKTKTNPAVSAVFSNLGIKNQDNVLSKMEGGKVVDRSRFAFIPSVTGEVSGLDSWQKRLALPTAPFSAGMARWNRLVEATLEQAPGGKTLGKAFGKDGFLSLHVQPGPAHKMFASIGLKSAKIGAAYMAMEEMDHWRRNFGTAGNLLVSAGTSAGIYAALNKFGKGKLNVHSKAIAAASFFGQALLPGFDQGLKQGIATGFTKLDVLGAQLNQLTGVNAYRRTLEGFLPGITSPEMSAAFALTGIGLSAAGLGPKIADKLPFKYEATSSSILNRIGIASKIDGVPKQFGHTWGSSVIEAATVGGGQLKVPRDGMNPPWQLTNNELKSVIGKSDPQKLGAIKRRKLVASMYKKVQGDVDDVKWLQDELYRRHEITIQNFKQTNESLKNPMNKSFIDSLERINQHYQSKKGIGSKLARKTEVFASRVYHSFMGASMQGADFDKSIKNLNVGKMGRYTSIAAGAVFIHQVLSGSLFGLSDLESPDDLQAIYSGKKLVKVKRGRYWEGGGTPYEGLETEYMRPHAYALMMSRAKEKATWGEDTPSPISQFFIKNFTYGLEERNYYDRPYPMTGAAFQDVPVIGNILAATIGKLIKPAGLMHTSEYMREGPDGNIEFAHRKEFHGPAMNLGGLPMGIPDSPFAASSVAAEAQYKFRDIEGLTGWAKNMVQKGLTGVESFGRTKPVFANAGSIDSNIESFWDLNLGGALFMSEPIRRLLPNPRSEILEYNPLLNRMPTWMPDRFKHGDPYRRVEQGWSRMPGAGYASLHPMLEGVDPEAYPDIYKYSILADVAPTSKEFSIIRQKMYTRRSQNITTESENRFMDMIDVNLAEVMVKRDFDHPHSNAIQLGGISSATQWAWQKGLNVVRDVAAPAEYMMPMGFRPVQKLLGQNRDMVEQYEYERMYGTPNAFWDKPWRDWFRPSLYSAAHMMGFDGKPMWRQEADRIGAHFDEMEFTKWMNIANNASNPSERLQALRRAQGTRFGVNPSGDAMSVYMALPESEKKFFDAFSFAQGSDRKRILEMVPEDQAALYQNVWSRVDAGDPTLLSGAGGGINERHLQDQYAAAMRTGNPSPGVDWIGWHKDVEMDDVKLRYIEHLGKDLYDHDLYQKQSAMMARKPYMDGADQYLYQAPPIHRGDIMRDLSALGRYPGYSTYPSEFSVYSSYGNQTSAELYYNDNRETDIISAISTALGS